VKRKNPASKHAWYYVRNLGGESAGVRTSDEKPEQNHKQSETDRGAEAAAETI